MEGNECFIFCKWRKGSLVSVGVTVIVCFVFVFVFVFVLVSLSSDVYSRQWIESSGCLFSRRVNDGGAGVEFW